MTDPQEPNLVGGLSDQIVRVSAKAERWRGCIQGMSAQESIGIKMSLQVMEAEINTAREALNLGDPIAMMASYQALEGYSDEGYSDDG